jgi:uncharacterized metal-binding protein YceD (DUF177 family)
MLSSVCVNIDELEGSANKTLDVKFDDFIEGINSAGKIEAELTAMSLGEIIEVKGRVKGTVKLECDLCLEAFEHNLDFEINELFTKNALHDEYSAETELKEGQFITDLEGAHNIDVCDLLYQSVTLNLPNKNVCDINCKGQQFLRQEEVTDPRLSVFKNINIEKYK